MKKTPLHSNKKKHLNKNPLLQLALKKFNNDIAQISFYCQPKTILDVGCGEGFTTIIIAKKLPHTRITAIDTNKESIRYAQKNNPANNISYQQGDIFSLQSYTKQFDLVVCNEVLEHLVDYKKALTSLCHSSKQQVLISVPNEPWFQIANMLRLKYLSKLGNHPEHINQWTKRQFKLLLSRHGHLTKLQTSTFWNIALLTITN